MLATRCSSSVWLTARLISLLPSLYCYSNSRCDVGRCNLRKCVAERPFEDDFRYPQTSGLSIVRVTPHRSLGLVATELTTPKRHQPRHMHRGERESRQVSPAYYPQRTAASGPSILDSATWPWSETLSPLYRPKSTSRGQLLKPAG